MTDLTRQEKMIFAPLIILTILLGIYPALILDLTGPSVEALVENFHAATAEAGLSSKLAASQ